MSRLTWTLLSCASEAEPSLPCSDVLKEIVETAGEVEDSKR